MKKFRLDLDALDVQSFVTLRLPDARGTVRGAGIDEPVEADTQYQSCGITCHACESGYCITGQPYGECLTYFTCGDCYSGFVSWCDETCEVHATC